MKPSVEARLASLERQKLMQWILIVLMGIAIGAIGAKVYGEDLSTPAKAVSAVAADLQSLSPSEAAHVRYIWFPPWAADDWRHAMSFAINTAASHSPVIVAADELHDGSLHRWHLPSLGGDLKNLLETWSGLAKQDPYFHVLTKDKVPIISPYIVMGMALAQKKQTPETVSIPPVGYVYRADWFMSKLLTTLEGGKYYEFAGMRGKNQDQILESFGVFEKISAKLNGDKRVGMFQSGVTGKPRSILALRGLLGNAWATEDIFDEDIDAARHPIYNLLNFDERAREIIIDKQNGLHAFFLVNDDGELQDSVPDNIARDGTIPFPNTNRLQPAISCIRCHGVDDGLKPVRNDVAAMLTSGMIDVFDDRSQTELRPDQIVLRLAGLYSGGKFESMLREGRNNYSASTFKLGGLSPSEISEKTSEVFNQLRYELVTPQRVCRELWHPCEEGEGVQVVRNLLPELPKVGSKIAFEDPVVGAVKSGLSVTRSDFERVYADMALRVVQGKATTFNVFPQTQTIPIQGALDVLDEIRSAAAQQSVQSIDQPKNPGYRIYDPKSQPKRQRSGGVMIIGKSK